MELRHRPRVADVSLCSAVVVCSCGVRFLRCDAAGANAAQAAHAAQAKAAAQFANASRRRVSS